MTSLIFALLSLPIVHFAARPFATQETGARLPKAEDVLAKLEADGGSPEARAKVRNIATTAAMAVEGLPGEGRLETFYAGTDKVRWNMALPGCAGMTQGTTGAFSWSSDAALGVTIREGDEQGAVLRQFGIARNAPWRTMYARAETVGATKVEGRDALEIRMVPAKGEAETWVVDAETSRLVYADQKLPDPLGGTISVRTWLSDWKAVDGVRYAHTTKLQFGAPGIAQPGVYAIVTTVKSIEHPAEIAAEKVAPPEEVMAAYRDPSKRTKEAPEKAGECVVTKMDARPTASVRVKIRGTEVMQNLAVILPEVMMYLSSVGADMAGPPFTRYHGFDGDMVDLEAGFPLKKKVEGKGRIQAGELPGGDVAVTWHIGPYEELAKSHALLEKWMKEKSLESRGGAWEVYWTDPGIEPDPQKWRTQVIWPVKTGK